MREHRATLMRIPVDALRGSSTLAPMVTGAPIQVMFVCWFAPSCRNPSAATGCVARSISTTKRGPRQRRSSSAAQEIDSGQPLLQTNIWCGANASAATAPKGDSSDEMAGIAMDAIKTAVQAESSSFA